MNMVFADASFWIGLRNLRDQFHLDAVRLSKLLIGQRVHLVITPLVFAEVHAHFCRARQSRERVIRDCWDNPIVRIEQPLPSDQRQALEILRAQSDKSYSFCDAVSFAVMLRLKIGAAVSFDQHFRQFGHFKIIGVESQN
jgi:predicted nucleic acid-binding protein